MNTDLVILFGVILLTLQLVIKFIETEKMRNYIRKLNEELWDKDVIILRKEMTINNKNKEMEQLRENSRTNTQKGIDRSYNRKRTCCGCEKTCTKTTCQEEMKRCPCGH